MITEKRIDEAFEKWVESLPYGYRGNEAVRVLDIVEFNLKQPNGFSQNERLTYMMLLRQIQKEGFKAALKLLLPVIEKQQEALEFYGKDIEAWGEAEDGSLALISTEDLEMVNNGFFERIKKGGKRARDTLAQVNEELKKLGGAE